MKKRRELKVGDKVRFEHQYMIGTDVGAIQWVSIDWISLATSKGNCVITPRQVISVFVKKKKIEPEEFWVNEYPEGHGALYRTKEALDGVWTIKRTAILRLQVVERIKVGEK